MAVSYKIKQYKNSTSSFDGSFYARAVATGHMDLDEIAVKVQRNCSLKKSDVKACLEELIEVVHDALCDGKTVTIDGFGILRVSLKSHLVKNLTDFNPTEHIDGVKVNFLPAYTVGQDKKRTVALIEGARVQSYGEYVQGANDTYDTNSGSPKKTKYEAKQA